MDFPNSPQIHPLSSKDIHDNIEGKPIKKESLLITILSILFLIIKNLTSLCISIFHSQKEGEPIMSEIPTELNIKK